MSLHRHAGGSASSRSVIASAIALIVAVGPAIAGELNEIPVVLPAMPKLNATITPISMDGAPRGPGCPQQQRTYTEPSNFQGGTFNLQGGFVETEIAAVSYQIPADQFPLRIDLMEFILGTQNATVQTVTQYSVLVWEGNPNNGNLIFTVSSDDLILQHARIGPGTAGVNIQVSVDPNDPEQIIVQDNGSHRFSIGIRIDDHNNEPVPPTTCSCSLGSLPAICCPPPPASNAFPATDTSGLASAANNWLYARDCPGATGLCTFSPNGWFNFTTTGMPSGDWVIRASYTPFICPGFGACCVPGTGFCQSRTESDCIATGGEWQGEGTSCSPNPCPQPSGACCRVDGSCDENTPMLDCDAMGEQFYLDTMCSEVECIQPTGACCTLVDNLGCVDVTELECEIVYNGNWRGPNTPCSNCAGACCFGTFCLLFFESECNGAEGSFQGIGTQCAAESTCPSGACCLPSGACTSGPIGDCLAQGGIYQGNGTACGSVNCPQPTGACCLSNGNCFLLTQANCNGIPNSNWAGGGTTCPGGCQPPCPGADGDLNGDTLIDARDLTLFTSALLSGGTQNERCHGDFDGSTTLDVNDIPGMVGALLNE